MRIAEKFGLKKGDAFSISPFGTDDVYNLVVAGLFRNVSENVVITDKYAAKTGIP